MRFHQIKPNFSKKPRKRVGRGGKKGTYSGRGIKGQKSRSGKKPRPDFVGGDTLPIKRFPKKKGASKKVDFKRGVKINRYKRRFSIVNLKDLEKHFKNGELVTPKSLLNKKLIDKINGRIPPVKILGQGLLTRKLIIKGCQMSEKVKKILNEIQKKRSSRRSKPLKQNNKK